MCRAEHYGTYCQVSHRVRCFLFSVDPNINQAFSPYFNSGLLPMSLTWMLTVFHSSTDPWVMLIHSVNGTDIPSADGTDIPSIHHDLDGVNPHNCSVNGTDVQLTLTGGTMPPFLFLMALEFPNIRPNSSHCYFKLPCYSQWNSMVNDNTTFVALASTTLEAPVSTFNAISVTVVASHFEQLELMERWQCVTWFDKSNAHVVECDGLVARINACFVRLMFTTVWWLLSTNTCCFFHWIEAYWDASLGLWPLLDLKNAASSIKTSWHSVTIMAYWTTKISLSRCGEYSPGKRLINLYNISSGYLTGWFAKSSPVETWLLVKPNVFIHKIPIVFRPFINLLST